MSTIGTSEPNPVSYSPRTKVSPYIVCDCGLCARRIQLELRIRKSCFHDVIGDSNVRGTGHVIGGAFHRVFSKELPSIIIGIYKLRYALWL